jgi:VIT1/CCC1 family predicted Fe2+/Mn2+ transporter
MIPYFIFTENVQKALYVSSGITGGILLGFGFMRARLIGTSLRDQIESAFLTLFLGGVAAGVAYGVVYGVNNISSLKSSVSE